MPMSSGGRVVSSDASPDQRGKRLVRPATPGLPNALCSLGTVSWQRPNIGSRVTREGHARFWERPEVKFLPATRHLRLSAPVLPPGPLVSSAGWIESFCDLVQRWKPLGRAEETGQIRAGVGPFIDRRMRERHAYVARTQFPTRGDKAVRAQAIRGRMGVDGLYVP